MLQGARAQRIEYLLLHEFYGRGFILPDKLTAKEREAELRKAKSKGKAEEDGDDEGEGEAPAGERQSSVVHKKCFVLLGFPVIRQYLEE